MSDTSEIRRAATQVGGVTLHRLPSAADARGLLVYGEALKEVPFAVERFFVVYRVPGTEVRGEHAHRKLHQLLVCVHGHCNVIVDDGLVREEFRLDDPTLALYVPPMVWCVQHQYTSDAVLLVLASAAYDADDYIRNYPEFLQALAEGNGA
jgi:dTDP-4-dehydrorhamnose 3,5-epimerase-like enzyme